MGSSGEVGESHPSKCSETQQMGHCAMWFSGRGAVWLKAGLDLGSLSLMILWRSHTGVLVLRDFGPSGVFSCGFSHGKAGDLCILNRFCFVSAHAIPYKITNNCIARKIHRTLFAWLARALPCTGAASPPSCLSFPQCRGPGVPTAVALGPPGVRWAIPAGNHFRRGFLQGSS